MLMYLVPSKFSAAMAAWESTGIDGKKLFSTSRVTRTMRLGSLDPERPMSATLPTVIPLSRTGAPAAMAAESSRKV